MEKNIAVFLDRDGTINEEVGYLNSPDKLKIIPASYQA
ncbi:MAG: D,D-heptose 1,7-bisphosphate phosphatase, partial [Syntrophaceae bacterium]|nr:D,D-heptose 1,7-bisphosphate phosphatase [Syntrophaceae bacterium]